MNENEKNSKRAKFLSEKENRTPEEDKELTDLQSGDQARRSGDSESNRDER